MQHFSITIFSVLLLFAAQVAFAEDLPKNAKDVHPIAVGERIPDLNFLTADEKNFKLNTALKQAPALLILYRGSWCPYCNTHLAELRKIEKEISEMGIQIYAISPDLPKYLTVTDERHKPAYTLLSDSSMTAAKALGLAFKVNKFTRIKLKAHDIDLERSSGEGHHLLPVPAAILVDKKGRVDFIFYAPDYKIRIDNEVLLAAAKSLASKEK
ncbi:Peroxiredoxin [Alteromonadaceae bacterium Bs31]|nr:Peroxiredoxin [Alteromonadaceae bacterium Bs31]